MCVCSLHTFNFPTENAYSDTRLLRHNRFEQHSISIFAVNLDIASPVHSAAKKIVLTLAIRMSKNIILFAQSAVTRQVQICRIISTVTGFAIGTIQVQALAPPGRVFTVFDVVISTPQYRSPYQEQRVQRLTLNLARSGTSVRNRIEDMFLQLIQTWSPDYTSGNVMEILGASVYFPGDIPTTTAANRRLLNAESSSFTPFTHSQAQDTPPVSSWNQTSSIFVRSYDTAENSDSMLAFLSTDGRFSRMYVLSLRYSLSLYCLQNEQTNLQVIQERLAAPMRTASGDRIEQIIAVALAPAVHAVCDATPPEMSQSAPNSSRRSNLTHDPSVLLRVEIVAYTSVTGTLTLTATQQLLDAGVEQISITATKRKMNTVDFTLDTLGFHSDGSLVLSLQTIPEPLTISQTAAIITAVVAGVIVLLSGLMHIVYKQQQHRSKQQYVAAPITEPGVQYSALNVLGGGYSAALQYNTDADMHVQAEADMGDAYTANLAQHCVLIRDDSYAAWRGRVA